MFVVVSEADLICRLASSDKPEPGFFRALFYDRERAAAFGWYATRYRMVDHYRSSVAG